MLPQSREHTLTGTRAPDSTLVLLSPHPNTTYRIDPTLALSVQQIKIEVSAGPDISQVTFYVDGNPVTTVSSVPYQAWWTLSVGEHLVWAEAVKVDGERSQAGSLP